MKKNMRCPACGRKRKNSHEERAAGVRKDKQGKTLPKYHPDCVTYEK